MSPLLERRAHRGAARPRIAARHHPGISPPALDRSAQLRSVPLALAGLHPGRRRTAGLGARRRLGLGARRGRARDHRRRERPCPTSSSSSRSAGTGSAPRCASFGEAFRRSRLAFLAATSGAPARARRRRSAPSARSPATRGRRDRGAGAGRAGGDRRRQRPGGSGGREPDPEPVGDAGRPSGSRPRCSAEAGRRRADRGARRLGDARGGTDAAGRLPRHRDRCGSSRSMSSAPEILRAMRGGGRAASGARARTRHQRPDRPGCARARSAAIIGPEREMVVVNVQAPRELDPTASIPTLSSFALYYRDVELANWYDAIQPSLECARRRPDPLRPRGRARSSAPRSVTRCSASPSCRRCATIARTSRCPSRCSALA